MGAGEREPRPDGWPPTRGRPRVLVETDDPVRGGVYARVLSEEGFDVAVCPGPVHQPDGCPLLDQGSCPLAAEADAAIVAFTWMDAAARRVLHKHVEARSDLPILVHARGRHTGHPCIDTRTTWTELVAALRAQTGVQSRARMV